MRPPNLRKWDHHSCIRQDHWRHPDCPLLPLPFKSSQELSMATATASSVQQHPLPVILALFLSGSPSRLQLALLQHTCLIAFRGFSAFQDQVQIPCHAGKSLCLIHLLLLPFFTLKQYPAPQRGCVVSVLGLHICFPLLWTNSCLCFRSDLDCSHSLQEAFQDSQC